MGVDAHVLRLTGTTELIQDHILDHGTSLHQSDTLHDV